MSSASKFTWQAAGLLVGLLFCFAGRAEGQGAAATLRIVNETQAPVLVYWINNRGREQQIATLTPGDFANCSTSLRSRWVVRDQGGAILKQIAVSNAAETVRILAGNAPNPPNPNNDQVVLAFVNNTGRNVELFWLNPLGGEDSYGIVKPGETVTRVTFLGHQWVVRDGNTRQVLQRTTATKPTEQVAIGGGGVKPDQPSILPATVAVPNIVSTAHGQAEAALRAAGLNPKPLPSGETTAAGQVDVVFFQNPPAGQRVPPGTEVSLFFFTQAGRAPARQVAVPNVQGLARAAAEAAVQRAGLKPVASAVGTTTDQASAEKILVQDPAPNAMVAASSEVRIMYATFAAVPPVVGPVQVPNLTNPKLPKAVAEAILASVNLKAKGVEGAPGDVAGTVYSQQPLPGTTVPSGTEVTFFYFQAAATPMVTVPSLVNLQQAEALALLQGAGLRGRGAEGNTNNNPAQVGRIYSQTVAANSRANIGSEIGFSYYKAAPTPVIAGPVPVDGSSSDRLPSIMAVANSDDSLDIAWLRSDGRIALSTYASPGYAPARPVELNGLLRNLAGFAKDSNGDLYVLTAAQESQAAPVGGVRPGILNLHKITRGSNQATLFADINSTTYIQQTGPGAALDEAVVNPLWGVPDENRGTGRLFFANGTLFPMFTQNWGWDGRIYHQRASLKALDLQAKSVYNGSGYWSHCADLRLAEDGKGVVIAQTNEEGLGISKLSLTAAGDFEWSGIKRLAAAQQGHTSRLRLGGVARTGNGYLVAYTYGPDGFMWDHQDKDPPSRDDVFVVLVPDDFTQGILNGGAFMDSLPVASDVTTRPVTSYLPQGRQTARRMSMVDLRNGTYLLVWEVWAVNNWLGGGAIAVSPPWGGYDTTWAAVVDANGNPVVPSKEIGKLRLQKEGDAFYLPTSQRAGWVTGDAANGRMLLHTLDASLNLTTYPLGLQ